MKIKKLLVSILIFASSFLNAQYEKGTVYFKDGKVKKGFVHKYKSDAIQFKTEKKSKSIKLNYKDIFGFENENGLFKYKYLEKRKPRKVLGFDSTKGKIIYEKEKNPQTPKFVGVILTGKINLYAKNYFSMGIPIQNGVTFGGGNSTTYYIEKGGNFVELGNKIGKIFMNYFNDCPVLIEKIENKILRKNNVYGIVQFYNNNCE
tara:strand:- start:69 stop:680 length:612 start_codon:yes stop_codon:yes gene_type:complete